MTTSRERTFGGDTLSPAAARRFVAESVVDLLGARPSPLCEDLELVVSELVTNSVRAGSPQVHVAVSLDGDCVGLSVTDEATGWPEPREAGIHDTGGRGLALVSAVSRSWGVRMHGTGKMVWVELPV